MAFTPEQLTAIEATGKNITVAASAGSGKTTVLVERIMKRVMKDRVPLDKFLAMTFTEAAASEMKSRLFARLNEAIQDYPEEKEYCEEQLVLLSKAQISTIHSFCLNVIQENYAYIGFDLQRVNTIIAPEEEEAYFQMAFQDTIKHYEHLPAFTDLKQYYTTKVYDTQNLYHEILSLAAFLKEHDFEECYAHHKQLYTAKNIQSFPTSCKNAIFHYLLDYIQYLENSLDTLLLICEETDGLLVKKNYLQQMREACIAEDYATLRLYFHGFVQVVFPPVSGDDIFKKLQSELRDIEDTLLAVLFEESTIINDLHAQWPLIELLLQMGQFYNQRMEYYKEENAFMDFDDMELFAYQILSQYPEVADIYRQRYSDILVDEYQDSSKHQDKILSFITNGTNIFRVGDVKQSIYRFRNATPDLLKGYIEQPTSQDQVIFLRHNFRSNSQIINYVNHTFEDFMNLSSLQSNFANEDVALVGSKGQQQEDICVEYHVIKSDEIKDEEENMESSSTQIRAEYIASEIQRIHDREVCKWSDFVVLVRSNERKIDLKKAFNKLGVPNFIDSKDGFYKSNAVTYITSFIQCVLSPYVDNYFVALALSPFYELTDNDVAKITLRMRELDCHSYFEYAKLGEDKVLSQMIEDLTKLRYMSGLRDKLIYMYSVNQYYDTYTNHSDRTNLDSLLEKACAYEQGHSDGLEGFCSFITSLKEFKSSEAISINSQEDVVRVMTVHQSKGLQFSYVFYWGKEKANNNLQDKLLKEDNIGLSLDYMDIEERLSRTSLLRTCASHQLAKADVEEEIRVIYVALTRPKSKLILTTVLNSNQFNLLHSKGISTYELLKGECYGKWLLKKAMELNTIVRIKEISSLSLEQAPNITNKSAYSIPTLPDYPHLPLKHKPSYHGISLAPLEKSKATQIGTMLHRLLEIIDFQSTYTATQLEALAKEEFEDNSLVSNLNYSSILDFLEQDLTKQLAQYELHREYPFLYQDTQMVSGVIDLLAISDTDIYIVDYKSDTMTKEQLLRSYTDQLLQYQRVIHQLYPTTPIHLYIYSLHLNEYIEVELT